MNTATKMNVRNIRSNKGNEIPNQFEVTTEKGKFFQSYKSVIAFIPFVGKTQLDSKLASATAASTYAPIASPTFTGTVSGVTKTMVGLGNVDNTSDANKPVSTAAQSALDLKAPLASPTFTGTVTLPTGTITSGMILDGTIVNADINASAAIDATKISGTAVTQSDIATVTNTMLAGSIANAKLTNSSVTVGTTAISLGSSSTSLAGITTINSTTIPTSKTLVVTTDKLSVHAATTSAELAGVISDETGSGSLVFANSPTLVTPTLGAASATSIAFSDGTQSKEGVPSRTTISSKTADYTLSALTERDSMIEMNSSSATTLYVPVDATVNYPIGTSIDILRVGSGAVTVAATTPATTTINYTPGNKLRAQWSSATLLKRAANVWVLLGDLSA